MRISRKTTSFLRTPGEQEYYGPWFVCSACEAKFVIYTEKDDPKFCPRCGRKAAIPT
jgi:rRNA maturation endonuclease Nob1